MTITNGNGCTATQAITVRVNALPVALVLWEYDMYKSWRGWNHNINDLSSRSKLPVIYLRQCSSRRITSRDRLRTQLDRTCSRERILCNIDQCSDVYCYKQCSECRYISKSYNSYRRDSSSSMLQCRCTDDDAGLYIDK